MRIAANIADLTRYDAVPRQCLVAPVIQGQHICITIARTTLRGDQPVTRALLREIEGES